MANRKSSYLGLGLVSAYLFLIGLAYLRTWTPSRFDHMSVSLLYGLLGIGTVVTAVAVWLQLASSVRIYAAWLASFLVFNAIVYYATDGNLLEVAAWVVLCGALFAPVGWFLRSELRIARQGNGTPTS